MRDAKRFLGVELAGAKNQKTALAALEYYPKDKKIFLLDVFDRVMPRPDEDEPQSSDEALLELIGELSPGVVRIGVNVPMVLPPCIQCSRKTCPLPGKCAVPAVKWMKSYLKKRGRLGKVLDFTPYTQRPIELWIRYQVLPHLPETFRFEVDETLGGNKAPLAARMHFLKKHLSKYDFTEVWPKLTVAILGMQLGIPKRTIETYRQLEEGAQAREQFLDHMTSRQGVFIYERDVRKLANNLASFDAFICAYTALMADAGLCAKSPTGFPLASGWVEYPQLGVS